MMPSMKERSGQVSSTSKLVMFIYILGRDYLTLGEIEEIMLDMSEEKVIFSNGWLAEYANDVAKGLDK